MKRSKLYAAFFLLKLKKSNFAAVKIKEALGKRI